VVRIRTRFARAAEWLAAKATGMPAVGVASGGGGYLDFYRQNRRPNMQQLLDQYQRTAYACARINANAVSATPLRVFVQTSAGQRRPRCLTRKLSLGEQKGLRNRAGLETRLAKALEVEEVLDHPLIDLLDRVNPFLNRVTLLQLTDLYQEILGNAYWLVVADALGVPTELWPLLPQHMRLKRSKTRVIDHYLYGQGATPQRYEPEEVIHFRFPNLRDPYGEGMAPLLAAFEDVQADGKQIAQDNAMLDNRARPDAIVSPTEPIGQREAERLEKKLHRKFGKGGTGGVLVAESGMKFQAATFPPKQLESVARRQMSKVQIANVFDVPMSLLETENVNRANAEAGHYQHALMSVRPRCRLIEGAINEDLCPRFDERLFVAFDDPVPENREQRRLDHEKYLGTGVVTINEVREELGRDPVEFGDDHYLPMNLVPIGMAGEENGDGDGN